MPPLARSRDHRLGVAQQRPRRPAASMPVGERLAAPANASTRRIASLPRSRRPATRSRPAGPRSRGSAPHLRRHPHGLPQACDNLRTIRARRPVRPPGMPGCGHGTRRRRPRRQETRTAPGRRSRPAPGPGTNSSPASVPPASPSRPSRSSPAAASTSTSTSPAARLRSRVSTLPRSSRTSRSGRAASSCARRRSALVPTRAPSRTCASAGLADQHVERVGPPRRGDDRRARRPARRARPWPSAPRGRCRPPAARSRARPSSATCRRARGRRRPRW